jgi:hypothetical protein
MLRDVSEEAVIVDVAFNIAARYTDVVDETSHSRDQIALYRNHVQASMRRINT